MVTSETVKPMSRPGLGILTFSNGRELKPQAQSISPIPPKVDEAVLVKQENEQVLLVIDDEKLRAIIEKVKKLGGEVDSLSMMPRYKKFDAVGEKFTGYCLQYEKIKNRKGDMLDSILWYEAGGSLYYHSSVVLVEECRNKGIRNDRFFVGVYEGKPKNTYMKFDIRIKPMD
jgi:hypothetical protein